MIRYNLTALYQAIDSSAKLQELELDPGAGLDCQEPTGVAPGSNSYSLQVCCNCQPVSSTSIDLLTACQFTSITVYQFAKFSVSWFASYHSISVPFSWSYMLPIFQHASPIQLCPSISLSVSQSGSLSVSHSTSLPVVENIWVIRAEVMSTRKTVGK